MKTDLDNAATWIQVMAGIGMAACIAVATFTLGALVGHLINRKIQR